MCDNQIIFLKFHRDTRTKAKRRSQIKTNRNAAGNLSKLNVTNKPRDKQGILNAGTRIETRNFLGKEQ